MIKCVDWGLVKKYWGAGPEQRRVGGSSVLEPLVGRGCSIFSYPCSNSFQCQRTNKCGMMVTEKIHLAGVKWR